MEEQDDGQQHDQHDPEHDPHNLYHDYTVHPKRCRRCQWEDQRVQQRLRDAESGRRHAKHE